MKLNINLCRIIQVLEKTTQTRDAVMGSELGITIQERVHRIVLGNSMTMPSHCSVKNRVIHNTRKEKRTRKFHYARE